MYALLLHELSSGWPDSEQLVRVTVRLLIAAIVGAVVGSEREHLGKAAGLRTHMLVALGGALFVIIPLEAGMPLADVSRVIQGVAAGIGFIGGGAILKLQDERDIRGLTTAANIWLTAAVGMAAGMGRLGSAMLGIALAFVILSLIPRINPRHVKSGRRKASEER